MLKWIVIIIKFSLYFIIYFLDVYKCFFFTLLCCKEIEDDPSGQEGRMLVSIIFVHIKLINCGHIATGTAVVGPA